MGQLGIANRVLARVYTNGSGFQALTLRITCKISHSVFFFHNTFLGSARMNTVQGNVI